MQGYAWLYLIAYPIDYIIYAYNYIYGFSLFADAGTSQSQHGSRGSNRRAAKTRRTRVDESLVTHDLEGGDGSSIVDDHTGGNIAGSESARSGKRKAHT